jgi:hypothetical protein
MDKLISDCAQAENMGKANQARGLVNHILKTRILQRIGTAP